MNNIGIAAFVKHYEEENLQILYEDLLLNHTSFNKYTNDIKKHRNNLIYLTFFQIISSLFGMVYILFRRSFVYFIINCISLFLSFCGIYGSVKFHSITLIVHCVFTISITGGFFIYQILDLFLVEDTSYGNKKRVNDNIVMFLFSLPYFYDFLVGIYNYFLLKKISIFNSNLNKDKEMMKYEINEINKQFTSQDIEKHLSELDSKICIICTENQRNTVLNPCGHVLCCFSCAENLFNRRNGLFDMTEIKCPICRRGCDNYLKIIIS